MRRRAKRIFSITFPILFASLGCVHSSRSGSHGALRDFDSEKGLIEVATEFAGTGATRLHPDYVWESLATREGDEEVGRAFDQAMDEKDVESMRELMRVLELKFILDPQTSSLDLLGKELSDHFRKFDWQPTDYPGGIDGPNEMLADVMVDAMDNVRPERRANRSRDAVLLKSEATEDRWQFMTDQWTDVPGQKDKKLNKHALESFVAMHEQAAAEGVELVISSSHRLRSTAEANAARANNPAAVASFSSHSLGLAIDFRMTQGDQKFAMVTSPMSEVVRMRESPVHKWLHLRGEEFGWYPYQNEPWHWEYNPPGFSRVFWNDFPAGPPGRALIIAED